MSILDKLMDTMHLNTEDDYDDYDDFDDDFVVNEEQWTAQIAYYLDEHIDQFAIIEK